MRLESLGLIGNCQISALVARTGAIAWACMPRFDSEPIFGTLLDEAGGGQFLITAADGPSSTSGGEQRYIENTNVLETRFETALGSFRVLDFAPRFQQYDRMFRPTQLWRIIEPLSGTPRVRIVCDPRLGWSKQKPVQLVGSNHVCYEGYASQLRLTTDVPLSYVEGQPFTLTEPRVMALTWGAPIEEPLVSLGRRFLDETIRYWQRWVKHCNIPPSYQTEVIRSGLALKLHCFEDTGAIVAAMTTSIPESAGSGRTWDYRYCWLRDSYYTLAAFQMLGHFEERESFVRYLYNVAASAPDMRLQPLYRVDGGVKIDEHILPHWPGYEGEGPVRIGNAAADHIQHDIYGEMVLALAPAFVDERFAVERSKSALDLVERLARQAVALAGTPDAGIWEFRSEWTPQTFSSLMCWAAADRAARIAARFRPGVESEFRGAAERIRKEICDRAWRQDRRSFVGSYQGSDLDASLLQMASLRFLRPSDPQLRDTVFAVWKELGGDGWLQRYKLDDGFGTPTVAFVICTFWLIEALGFIGERAQAQAVMARVQAALTPLGLIAEDYDPVQRRMWGNFPQAYSHVGLIHAAFAASPSWTETM